MCLGMRNKGTRPHRQPPARTGLSLPGHPHAAHGQRQSPRPPPLPGAPTTGQSHPPALHAEQNHRKTTSKASFT